MPDPGYSPCGGSSRLRAGGFDVATKDIERGSSPLSRRTVLKAGAIAGTSPLWIAPAMSIVGLTPSLAQATSGHGCTTTYPSHAFLVFLVDGVYYAFKFGDSYGGALTPAGYNQSKDGVFLANTAPYKNHTIIGKSNVGTPAQQAKWASLLKGIETAKFSNTNGVGYTLTKAPSSLVGVYAYDGSFKRDNVYGVHAFSPVNGQYFITKCGDK